MFRLIVVFGLCLVGCTEPSPWDRIPLEGAATLDGASIEGALSLRPRQGNRGPAVTAAVKNGRYRFTSKTGPVAGANTAILMLPAEPGTPPSEASISLAVEVPSEQPFELQLDFAQPEEPAPKTPQQSVSNEAIPPTK